MQLREASTGNRGERSATTATERGVAETADEREASVGKDDTANALEKVHMHTFTHEPAVVLRHMYM